MFSGSDAVSLYRLHVMKNAVKLEAEGIKVSRRSWTAVAKQELGVKGSRKKVLEAIEKAIEEQRTKVLPGAIY